MKKKGNSTVAIGANGSLSPPKASPLLRASLALVFVLGCCLGYREIISPDIGFHLATARWMLANPAFPQGDFLTYTVTGHPYVDLQWIFQILVHGMYKLGGATAIALCTTALTLMVGGLLLWRTRQRLGYLPTSSLWLLLMFFLANLWETRPHLLSWILGSFLLLALEEWVRGSKRWLPGLPLVMLLWVNAHSLFVLGLVIIGTYCFAELLKQRKKADKALFVWAGIAGLACLVNPYHVNGLLFPLVQFQDIQASSAYKSTLSGIGEFTSPFSIKEYLIDGRLVLVQARLFWQLFSLAAVAGLLCFWKKARLAELVLFAGFLYIFQGANKNFGYFAMVVFPLASGGLERLGAAFETRIGKSRKKTWQQPSLLACSIVSILLIGLVASGHWYSLTWDFNRFSTGFNKSVLPVEACEFINKHNIKGRILNTWDDGGYIAWATEQPVFIYSHGEIMGDDFYREYVQSKQPGGFESSLEKWTPEIVVVPFKTAPYWLYCLDRHADWRLVHADRVSALYLHASIAPQIPALPRPQPGKDFPLFDPEEVRRILTRAARAKPIGFWSWLKGSRAYPRSEMARSSFYLQTAELDSCIGTSLAGLKKTNFLVPDLMLNLGHAFNARKRYDWSDLCFDAFLRAEKDPVIAREIQMARQARR